MTQKVLAELTNEELLGEAKKTKSSKIFDALAIGLLVGIAIYSSITNGIGLITFLPLVYIPIAARNNIKRKELEKLLKERNLE
ncbi:MAG TPA: FUSC family protein [Chryseolinea sp.]|nr:FUSC family protein [Chryseolinea sp.]HPH45366.1 FUSC family protein [Chryseolinea sp.]HPM28719.1 FUSC family protein [Chryseolinea sp.]